MDEHKTIDKEFHEIYSQLSWKSINEFINGFSKLRKNISNGGVRIIQKNNKIIYPIVKKECLGNNKYLSALFSFWFNEQKQYYDCLKPFFESEEHIKILEKKITNKDYVINDEFFSKFMNIIRKKDVDKFLLLSPIAFTSEQIKSLKYIRDEKDESFEFDFDKDKSEQSTDEKVAIISLDLKNTLKDLKKIRNDYEKLNKKYDKLNQKWEDDKRLVNDLKNNTGTLLKLQNDYDTIQTENKRLSDLCTKQKKENSDLGKKIDKIVKEYEVENKESYSKLKMFQNECEKLKEVNFDKEKLLQQFKNDLSLLTKTLEKNHKDKNIYFYQILSKLDYDELLLNLNAPDEVIELLGRIVRPPTTDETDIEETITLDEFWHKLLKREHELVNSILIITAQDVAQKKLLLEQDDFLDLKYSLSTRLYLVDMILNIAQQYLY